ncbi:MAG: glycerophosphodiester phosphodiesterase family protein [Verrucomicrobiota bacterium]
MDFIAHRGSSFLAPENTLAAFRLGWQETATCELDLRATRDGRLIVVHDASTRRTTGVDWLVAEHTLAELRNLDAGVWKGVAWAGERLPALEDVLAAMPAGRRLLIEVKAAPVAALMRVVRQSRREAALALQSFDLAACAEMKRSLPEVPVFGLVAFRQENGTWSPSLAHLLDVITAAQLDGIAVNDAAPLDAAAVAELHARGLRVKVWTIDDPARARGLAALGVDGLITNRPGWLRAQVQL